MNYNNIMEGIFISRPNRFIANIEIDGSIQVCHVKNTGRCKELLIQGCTVYVEYCDKPTRKTKYDLIAVIKNGQLINMDSQVPNIVAREWVQKGGLCPVNELRLIRPEKKYGNSRFDLYVETEKRKIFIEVKGVTLENNRIAKFPDAPTQRGLKHINELVKARQDGYEAYILFVIQMSDIRCFMPNDDTHPEFGEALRNAQMAGINVLAYECQVEKDSLEITKSVNVDITKY